jgi:hypothetical protein
MRSLSTFVTVGLTTLLLAAPATGATGASPGSSYQWQQPGCATVYTPCTQPQWTSAPVQLTGLQYASSSYAWAQPGTAPVSVPDAQPQ